MNRAMPFGSLRSAAKSERELTIKAAITRQLSESIKQLQLRGVDTDELEPDESASCLCQAVEAMFLHGLKDSLAYRVRRALADVDECPQPSFWAPIMVISHRQILDVIERSLKHITTEVGQCRAWIRFALNDGLLSSYLAALQQQDMLRPYYQWYAFLRDGEAVGVARSLLEGLSQLSPLPTNSSLLNTWAVPSLVLAGVWVPTMKEDTWSHNMCINSTAVDIARTLTSAVDPDRNSLSSFASFTSLLSGSTHNRVPYTEDEALRIILAKRERDQKPPKHDSSPLMNIQQAPIVQLHVDEVNDEDCAETYHESVSPVIDDIQLPVSTTAEEDIDLEHSYNELFSNMISDQRELQVGTPDLVEMVKDLGFSSTTSTMINVSVDEGIDDSVAPSDSLCKHQVQLNAQTMWQLARERGLDRQKYQCSGCAQPILHVAGYNTELNHQMRIDRGYMCHFSGLYFCIDCMADRKTAIPARILHNWDFKEYPVSLTALNYIEESQTCVTVDVRAANPLLYKVAPEMARCLDLRVQLTLVRAYLHTCAVSDEDIVANCCADVRDHMLEEWGLCSLADFLDVRSGVLRAILERAVSNGREHVMTCRVCSQRGFLCEICKDTKAIFPFDLINVFRCDICGSVSHKDCLTVNNPCRKCLRRKKFQDSPPPASFL